MRINVKRFFASASIVTLLAPSFLVSAEVFAEDFSTSESSEITTDATISTTPSLNEPLLDNRSQIETDHSIDDKVIENTTTSSSLDNDDSKISSTESTVTSEAFDGTTDSSSNSQESISTDLSSPTKITSESNQAEEVPLKEASSINDWTGGIGLDDLEIAQTIEETFTFNAADLIKNQQNENNVLKTQDGKIEVKLNYYHGFYSYSGFDQKENILDGSVYGNVTLADDSLGKLYSFNQYFPGEINVYSFDSTADRAFYLKEKNGKVTEYLLKFKLEKHTPTLEETFKMSEQNSGIPFSTKDGIVTITPDYDNFSWNLQTNDANWKILNHEPYVISKTYEKRSYHVSIYSEELHQVKSYEIPVERIISEGTAVEHEIDMKLSKNNQYRFENEFYQNYDGLIPGLSITAAFNGWSYDIRLNRDSGDYIDSLSYSNTEADANYVSYIEYRTWTGGFYDENGNWVEWVETITKLKLNISIDNTTEIDESKEKIFTFDLDHDQLIMNSKEDAPHEVTLNYNGPSNHSEVFHIAYLDTTDFNAGGDYNYQGEYVQVMNDNAYVNLLREDTPGIVEASSSYGNKVIFNINNAPTPKESSLTVDVSRKNDWDSPVEISPESDDLLKIKAYYSYQLYNVSYDYDYNGAFYYESPDWHYDYPMMTDSAEQIIYKRKSYTGKIVAIYKIKFNFEVPQIELQEPLSLNIPKKLGFNRVYQETPDGQVALVGLSNTTYEDGEFYFNAYAVPTKSGLANGVQIHYEGFSTYPGYERDSFLYTEGKDGIIKKYPVTVIPDTTAEAPTKKEYFTFDLSATSQELTQVSSDSEGLNGKQFNLALSEYEELPSTIFLDRDNRYSAYSEDTPANERFVLFFQGVMPFEKIGHNKYRVIIDWYPYLQYDLTITDNQVVDILPTKLTLSEAKVKIAVGETSTIKATITPENATNQSILWTSENEKIATVTNGVITGMKAGKTTITAETANGLKKSVTVTVEKETEKPIIKEELKDESGSGIVLSAPEGVLPKGAELKVEPIKVDDAVHQQLDKLTDGKFVLFDIKLYNSNAGHNVQPNGTVAVRVPIPSGFDPEKIKMYHFDETTGKRTAMKGWVEGAYYVFETNHFSYYTLVEEEPENDEDTKLPQIDKKELQTLISTALAFNQADYTEKSWAVFTEKLQVAQGVEANLLATEAEVEIAIKELNLAINTLVKQTGESKPETDQNVNDIPQSNDQEKSPVQSTNKADKTDKKTKKDDALPQLGGSVSIFLPVLGFVLITLSGLMFFKRNRLNMKK